MIGGKENDELFSRARREEQDVLERYERRIHVIPAFQSELYALASDLAREVRRLRAQADPTPAGPEDVASGTVAVVGYHDGMGPAVRIGEWDDGRWHWLSDRLNRTGVYSMSFSEADWFAELGQMEELRGD